MKKNEQRNAEIFQQYLNGDTYQVIAERLGISRAAVWRVVQRKLDRPPVKILPKHYPILAVWIENNLRGNVSEFARRLGLSRRATWEIITGKHLPNMVTIDSILAVTGLKYEEAFALTKRGESDAGDSIGKADSGTQA